LNGVSAFHTLNGRSAADFSPLRAAFAWRNRLRLKPEAARRRQPCDARLGQFEALEDRWMLSEVPVVVPSAELTAAQHRAVERSSIIAGGGGTRGSTGKQRLPDLTVWVSPEDGFLYNWYIDRNEPLMPGRTLLRLSNTIVNQGKGALELRPGEVNSEGKQEVFQRIFNDDGTFTDRLAGTFIYHPEHAHTHFEDFAQYNLRSVTADNGVGDVVASGDKVSFCLLDVKKYTESIHGSARTQHYRTCELFQGISVGWADVYHSGLADQWIDITDVPDGQYWLESVVDPSNRIVESNDSNNVARILITLGRPAGDDFPNDFSSAADLALTDKGTTVQAGQIERSDDVDVFSFVAPRKGKMRITQTGEAGGIDSLLAVFDSAERIIAQDDDSAGGLNSSVRLRVIAGQQYFVRAAGFGSTSGRYVLEMSTSHR
jgi:Lysyl oxidase